jgi:hypothetical protein
MAHGITPRFRCSDDGGCRGLIKLQEFSQLCCVKIGFTTFEGPELRFENDSTTVVIEAAER